jgi:hypothetical protein
VCLSLVKFMAHLINQGVAHELLALELLVLMLENPSDDGVEVAVDFCKDVGAYLQVGGFGSPQGGGWGGGGGGQAGRAGRGALAAPARRRARGGTQPPPRPRAGPHPASPPTPLARAGRRARGAALGV